MSKAKLTAARGASLSRQSIVAKLRRDMRAKLVVDTWTSDYIPGLIDWVNQQSLRAAKKPGGLGKR